jgi:L-ribulose-5-phosphate 3-epimerase
MNVDRRNFLGTAGVAVAAWSMEREIWAAGNSNLRVGMCDWNLGKMCDPNDIPKAKDARLNGIQVTVGTGPGNMPLRQKAVRQKYLDLGKQNGISFPSVAIGILNEIPLKSEPQAAVYVIDALEAAQALGSTSFLMAFFGKGDLRVQGLDGKYINTSAGPFKSYELDAPGVKRVVAVLKEIAPRAEDMGIAMGFENTLTAAQNLEIINQVGSPMLQVYYDVGNSTEYGYDVPTELKLLGNRRICEIHLKDWRTPMLGSPQGAVNFPPIAEACKAIGYNKWFVLETSGRKGKFIEDTRANVAFAQKTFV